MDNWWRFQYHLQAVNSDGATQEGRRSAPLVVCVQAIRERRQENPSLHIPRRDGERNTSSELADPMLPRKTSSED